MKKNILSLILIILSINAFPQIGKKFTYYDNGEKKELLRYYDNKLSGTCIAWNESGKIIAKVQYNDGIKNGKWFMWHDNGTPAYKFYYGNNKKVGVWKFYDEFGELSGSKKYDPMYDRNTLITIGTFTLSDFSLTITRRFNENKPYVVGLEYGTYVSDGEYDDFTEFEKFEKHTVLGVGGFCTDNWGILVKAGTCFAEEQVSFDYGGEVLMFVNEETMNMIPVIGFSVTKEMSIQMKFGIIF